MVAEQLPPHDIAAEEAVIASLLVDETGEAALKVFPILRPVDFFREKNAWAYGACLAVWDRGEPINLITVAHQLSQEGRLEELGGAAYLSHLTTELPTPVGVEYYAQIVQQMALYRRLLAAAGQIARLAYEAGPEPDDVLNRAEALLLGVRGAGAIRDFVPIRELLERYLEEAEQATVAAPVLGHIRTGFMDLDTILGGLRRSDLIILAARPSLGKTSLALNIARNAAVGQRARVAVFSLEMSADQVAQRMLAAEAGVDSTRLRLGQHTEMEERRINQAMGVLGDCQIYVDDSPFLRVSEMRAKSRRLAQQLAASSSQQDRGQAGLDLIIVDYLQLMYGDSRQENRVQEVSNISRSLKGLARELEAPVLAVSQLSRAPEMRSPHTPMLSDLRESGSLEQDADVVLFIYREDVYTRKEEWQRLHPDRPGDAYPAGIADIIIGKHRNGPTGSKRLHFREKFARFEDLLVREEEGA
ncbi:MAG TPA: replicative DNA helicase [Dehalococcoidia bacterium]|nr:replicative DNA helicase [Dehalococcoidia bacterium]